MNAIVKTPMNNVVTNDVIRLCWEIPSDCALALLLSLSATLRNSAVVGVKLEDCCPSSPAVGSMLGVDVLELLGGEVGYAEPEGTGVGYAEPEGTELGSVLDERRIEPELLGELLGSTLTPSPLDSSPVLVGSNKGMLLEGVPSTTSMLGVTEGSRLGEVLSNFVLGTELLIVGVADAEDVGVAEPVLGVALVWKVGITLGEDDATVRVSLGGASAGATEMLGEALACRLGELLGVLLGSTLGGEDSISV